VDAAVAGTGPQARLSGRSIRVYAANSRVPSAIRPTPASSLLPPRDDKTPGPASTATPARAIAAPAQHRRLTRSPRKAAASSSSQTGSLASTSPAVEARTHCSPMVTGRL
jgi:hypothetical protein